MSIRDLIHEAIFWDKGLRNLDNQDNRKDVQDARAHHRERRDEALTKVEEAKARAKRYGGK